MGSFSGSIEMATPSWLTISSIFVCSWSRSVRSISAACTKLSKWFSMIVLSVLQISLILFRFPLSSAMTTTYPLENLEISRYVPSFSVSSAARELRSNPNSSILGRTAERNPETRNGSSVFWPYVRSIRLNPTSSMTSI